MAKQRPEKQRDPGRPVTTRVLPMEPHFGDRLVDETGEWEVIAHPYTSGAGKNAHARVRLVEQPSVVQVRSWSAHERIAVRRG